MLTENKMALLRLHHVAWLYNGASMSHVTTVTVDDKNLSWQVIMPVLREQPLCAATCTCTIKKLSLSLYNPGNNRKVGTSFRTSEGDIGGNSTVLCYDLKVFPKKIMSWKLHLPDGTGK